MAKMKEKLKELYIENTFLGALIVLDSVRLIEMEKLKYTSFFAILQIIMMLVIAAFIYKSLATYLNKPGTKPLIRAGIHIILGVLFIFMF